MLEGYRGHVDAIEPVLSGWVSDVTHPAEPVVFLLDIDRTYRIPVIADRPRADVAAAGLAGPNCGFSKRLPASLFDGREHELALQLSDGRRLDLPGLPASVALGRLRVDLVPARAVSPAAVRALLRQTSFEAGDDPSLVGITVAAAFNAINVPDAGFLFYARADGRLVGYGRLDRGQGGARALGVASLTVLAAYRRKGLGEALMRALLRAAAEDARLSEVWLSVRPNNIPAVRLYEKLGFMREADHPPGNWPNPGEVTMVWAPARERI